MTTTTSGEIQVLRFPSRFHPNAVHKTGEVIVRSTGPWTPTVHSLLRHLEAIDFAGAPGLVGSGFDDQGRETLTCTPGEFTQPGRSSLLDSFTTHPGPQARKEAHPQ